MEICFARTCRPLPGPQHLRARAGWSAMATGCPAARTPTQAGQPGNNINHGSNCARGAANKSPAPTWLAALLRSPVGCEGLARSGFRRDCFWTGRPRNGARNLCAGQIGPAGSARRWGRTRAGHAHLFAYVNSAFRRPLISAGPRWPSGFIWAPAGLLSAAQTAQWPDIHMAE